MVHRVMQGGQPPWSLMKRFEPKLASLERRATYYRKYRGRRFWRAYESMKDELQYLVGWNVRHPLLGTSEAYDEAHRAILAAMEG